MGEGILLLVCPVILVFGITFQIKVVPTVMMSFPCPKVTVNELPLHIVYNAVSIDGPGFTVTVKVNGLPGQGPEEGVME